MAHDSQIVRAKENLKLSYGGPSQRQTLGTNQWIKALRQGIILSEALTHRRAIKVETIAINRDWVYNQACRLTHDSYAVSHFFITFIAFYILFKLISKTKSYC